MSFINSTNSINSTVHNALQQVSIKCCLRSATSRTGIWYHHHQSELVGDVAVPVSARQAVLFWAFRSPDARPRLNWRRSSSTVLSQVCLGRPGRRLQFLGAGDMQACRARGNDLETCRPGPRGQTTSGVWSAQYLIAVAGQYADGKSDMHGFYASSSIFDSQLDQDQGCSETKSPEKVLHCSSLIIWCAWYAEINGMLSCWNKINFPQCSVAAVCRWGG